MQALHLFCIRFQETVKKFVKSMGDMQQRLGNLEDKVEQIQQKQESFHVPPQQDNNIKERRAVESNTNLDAQHKKEVEFENFVGYACNMCIYIKVKVKYRYLLCILSAHNIAWVCLFKFFFSNSK